MKRFGADWGGGPIGVIIFSGSLPTTRVAVGGLGPVFLTSVLTVMAPLMLYGWHGSFAAGLCPSG